MCCGYKPQNDDVQECILTVGATVDYYIPSEQDQSFKTITLEPECKNDDTFRDQDGDSCYSYYDLDNTVCGLYDTEDFISNEQCCSCQPEVQKTVLTDNHFS